MENPACPRCLDDGTVCEEHPGFPFGVPAAGHACDWGIGIPCPYCCSPVPQDGTHSIGEAFTPGRMRETAVLEAQYYAEFIADARSLDELENPLGPHPSGCPCNDCYAELQAENLAAADLDPRWPGWAMT